MIRNALDASLPPTLYVVGQISNYKRHSSGHCYFTLKDASSELSCVMWRSSAEKLRFAPADGLEVIATGNIEVFERAGRYQLYVRKLEPRGVGALELAFRQLCEKLAREGLFDERHKKPLPRYPRRIALVTSPTGAAIADMLRTIQRRFPCVHVLLHPVRVQGPGAAEEIAAAVSRLSAQADRLGGIDLMVVGRGGGSLEDLWAFNEEVVARAIFASQIPVMSAVGHEVDVTIADLVADVRAATPTAAAELAVPVLDEVLTLLASQQLRLHRSMRNCLQLSESRLTGVIRRRALAEPTLALRHALQSLDGVAHRVRHGWMRVFGLLRSRLDRCEQVIQRITPHSYLRRNARLLDGLAHRLTLSASRATHVAERRLLTADSRLREHAPAAQVPHRRRELLAIEARLRSAVGGRMRLADQHCASAADLLEALSHRRVLQRGFSITRLKRGGRLVRSSCEVGDGQRIVTEVADGSFESEVVNVKQLELFDGS